jgi:hypothetical protein
MFARVTTNSKLVVSIDNFGYNQEVTIMLGDKYLSCAEHDNVVDWYVRDDLSGRQKWIIEMINGDLFIRTSICRYNGTVYLGSPNYNNIVHMYTTKNEFTKWSIYNHPDLKNMYYLDFVGCKFDPTSIELVVARYKENIEWVNAYSNIATVYNKGPRLTNPDLKIIPIANKGREGHTYLYHMNETFNCATKSNMLKRYIYSQGDPFDHNETFLYAVDNYTRLEKVQPLGLVYLRKANIPPPSVERKMTRYTDFGLKYGVLVVDANLLTPLFEDDGINDVNATFRGRPEHKNYAQTSLMEYFLEKSGSPKRIDKVFFTYSALFSITHESLCSFGSSYKIPKMINTLLKIHPQGAEYGYILERLWLYLFEYNNSTIV